MERCALKRENGNLLVKEGNHAAAKEMYCKALEDVKVLFSDPSVKLSRAKVIEVLQMEAAAKINKAFCLLKLGDARGCIQSAQEVVFGPSSMLPRLSCSIDKYVDEVQPKLLDKAKLRMIQGYIALENF